MIHLENSHILIPFLIVALCIVVVGIVLVALGTVEWITSKPYVPVRPVAPRTAEVDNTVKRLEELATLERNARLASEKK